MPIDTHNLIGVDSDRYDNRAPERPHYNSTPYKAQRFAFPPLWVITTFVIALLPLVGVLSWAIVRLLNWVADINYIADDFDGNLLVFVKFAFAFAVAVILIGVAALALAFVASKLVIRLQNNMPVSLLEILFAGNYIRELTRNTLRDYAAERRTLWENSGLWALETLDLSSTRHTATPPAILPGDVIDVPPVHLLPTNSNDETNAAMLLRTGLIGRSGNSLLAGFSAADKPHYMELNETGFISILGYPRVGKSATAAFLASQMALIPNAQLFICDKHAHRHDSLTRRLDPLGAAITARAGDMNEIGGLIDRWYEIGRDRLNTASNDHFPPVLLIIDEYTSMILLEELPEALLRRMLSGSVEFPKVQTHGLYIAHQFTGRLMGGVLGTPLRRVTTQRIIMRSDPADALFVLPDRKVAQMAPKLGEGRAFLFGQTATTPIEIGIPEFTARDVAFVASVLPGVNSSGSGAFDGAVSRVSDVSNASGSGNAAATAPTNGTSAADASNTDADTDVYARNQALTYLQRRNGNGEWVYSIRDVQAMTALRTQTIVQLAHSIGRKRTSNGEN